MERKVADFVSSSRDELIDLVADLIRLPTANPPGEKFTDFVDFVADWLEDAGLRVNRFEVPSEELSKLVPSGMNFPRLSICGKIKGVDEHPALCLNGHYDTVRPTADWNRDPLAAVIENGRIHGLGTIDMKGSIAAMMLAAKALIQCECKLRGELILLFNPDEEVSSEAGLRYILKKNLIHPDYAIVGEYTEGGPANICIGQKGALWGTITTHGRSAHGALTFRGINAFDSLLDVASAIRTQLAPILATRTSKFQFASEQESHPTIMLGGALSSSGQSSVVPDLCTMSFDRRIIPDETTDDARRELQKCIEDIQRDKPELKVDMKVQTIGEHFAISSNDAICRTIGETINEIIGRQASYTIGSVWTEAVLFANKGISTVVYGPGPGAPHSPEESVSIEDLITICKIYAITALKLLR